jgi:AbrB family looped-hinge helix DNA binding protein
MHHDVVMDSRGRVTLPKALRTALGLGPGTRIVFLRLPGGTVLVQVRRSGVDSVTVQL